MSLAKDFTYNTKFIELHTIQKAVFIVHGLCVMLNVL